MANDKNYLEETQRLLRESFIRSDVYSDEKDVRSLKEQKELPNRMFNLDLGDNKTYDVLGSIINEAMEEVEEEYDVDMAETGFLQGVRVFSTQVDDEEEYGKIKKALNDMLSDVNHKWLMWDAEDMDEMELPSLEESKEEEAEVEEMDMEEEMSDEYEDMEETSDEKVKDVFVVEKPEDGKLMVALVLYDGDYVEEQAEEGNENAQQLIEFFRGDEDELTVWNETNVVDNPLDKEEYDFLYSSLEEDEVVEGETEVIEDEEIDMEIEGEVDTVEEELEESETVEDEVIKEEQEESEEVETDDDEEETTNESLVDTLKKKLSENKKRKVVKEEKEEVIVEEDCSDKEEDEEQEDEGEEMEESLSVDVIKNKLEEKKKKIKLEEIKAKIRNKKIKAEKLSKINRIKTIKEKVQRIKKSKMEETKEHKTTIKDIKERVSKKKAMSESKSSIERRIERIKRRAKKQ
jgi:hypothetical protein